MVDISEQYIKMCDCEEVQGKRKDMPGDILYFKDEEYVAHVCGIRHCAMDIGYYESEDSLWLPRQDQIQAMLELPPIGDERFQVITPFGFAYKLYGYAEEIRNPNEAYPAKSMEQLWLMFYMHEKHNKKWDGEKWK